jgi:hypothetical protein
METIADGNNRLTPLSGACRIDSLYTPLYAEPYPNFIPLLRFSRQRFTDRRV